MCRMFRHCHQNENPQQLCMNARFFLLFFSFYFSCGGRICNLLKSLDQFVILACCCSKRRATIKNVEWCVNIKCKPQIFSFHSFIFACLRFLNLVLKVMSITCRKWMDNQCSFEFLLGLI
jgi:hypothetical protein